MTYKCVLVLFDIFFFFFKQKTAYEMRISDWSSDVCSPDLLVNSRVARWRGFFRTIYFAPVVTTLVAVALIWRYLFHAQYGLIDWGLGRVGKIGRASCRERVCQYV